MGIFVSLLAPLGEEAYVREATSGDMGWGGEVGVFGLYFITLYLRLLYLRLLYLRLYLQL